MDPKDENLLNTSPTELARRVDDGILVIKNVPLVGLHFSRRKA